MARRVPNTFVKRSDNRPPGRRVRHYCSEWVDESGHCVKCSGGPVDQRLPVMIYFHKPGGAVKFEIGLLR